MLVFVETFYSKPGGWLNRGGEWSPISINTLQSLQYSAPAQPLSQTKNNLSVRCFVRDLKLLTVTDYWVQRGVEGAELNLETVRKLQIWRGKMRPVTRGCSVQLFKNVSIVPAPRLLQQRPVSSLPSFKVNQLYSPDRRGEKVQCSPQEIIHHFLLLLRPYWESL